MRVLYIAAQGASAKSFCYRALTANYEATAYVDNRRRPSSVVLPTALLINDEEPLRHLVRRMLEPEVRRIVEASDGETGLRLLEQADGEIALVIPDLLMPGLDGLDVLAVIQAHDPHSLRLT